MSNTLITILGPTATGKTALAAEVAWRLGGEVISADSRQVFRGMDLGTGKDLADYDIHGTHIPYHIIDICSPHEEYNAYRFMGDFRDAFTDITGRGRQPILCGGTGLYLDAVIRGYHLPDAPVDPAYRATLESFSDEELTARLASYIPLHNHTDTETRDRLVRALEIQEFAQRHPDAYIQLPPIEHRVFGINFPRQVIIDRIEARLRQRLGDGMTAEVQRLLDEGVPAERLMRFGLEYRHNPTSRKYAERMMWRAGVNIQDEYLSSIGAKRYTASIGIGFPLYSIGTTINTTIEYSHRGKKAGLEEHCLRFTLGVGIAETWFFKRKL